MTGLAAIIPTCNGGALARECFAAIKSQTLQPAVCLVVDSGSQDQTRHWAGAAGFEVREIPQAQFDHGATRQQAFEWAGSPEIAIYLTQDAILADAASFQRLVAEFDNPRVGLAYGRQLPASDANPRAAHARLFNYRAQSSRKGKADIAECGIKAAFVSNSFAAYRRSALLEAGGFPGDVIFGEDTCVAARMLLCGWEIAYCAQAEVFHSHNYRCHEELRRYFDIGVFHSRQKWFLEKLGKAEGEGKKFVVSELGYLFKNAPWQVPAALFRTCLKYLGYKLGGMESLIPVRIKKKISMNGRYWK